MATEVFMPKLGMTMEKGTIIRWFKEVGEPISAGEPLLEVLTDKINIDVEAYVSGILLKRYYEADTDVPVNEVIGYIGQAGEMTPDNPPAAGASGEAEPQAAAAGQTPAAAAATDEQTAAPGKVRATPAAKKAAREHDVQLHLVAGTGENGRIHRANVLDYVIRTSESAVKATPLAAKIAASEQIDLRQVQGSGVNGKITRDDVLHGKAAGSPAGISQAASDKPVEKQKIEGLRKIIGERMVHSAFTAPHVTLHSEIDMSLSVQLRQSLLGKIEKQTGFRVSYTEIIVKAVAHALLKHPLVNATIEGDYIRYNADANVGLAVASAKGLIVPVIKQADGKGLAQLTTECKTLAGYARDNKLKPEHITGGTFTISNLGMYAVDTFTPIINQPESAILGVGRIQDKPVGVNGAIVLRPMMSVSLSFDHRIIDGAPAAAFLTDLKALLENPYELLI
ncbi:2-oxo acid dehydrogenase subunit E2 [Paenibacillus thalictri]|uniref:Dihydrolipoamide acetyltransferase component of pyruvate dehydrogenase complex n=1 Tax=Paenibacillus thalictri TaxID=2527873 RepID=A0A4Q9E0B9_9BACL|nr:2-oxo acid dehydrogenase subunit E2 [Paenibacillus thalictri]TBL81668.1 2-oxo acid dehydrogenase subunit E2 [Paenibacillus thalictri]